uniref:Uncharacterized protein n=1 Tax=Anguilla anguilla TaxID=7936 RepID=A0A0E9QY14_ANGAN
MTAVGISYKETWVINWSPYSANFAITFFFFWL